MKIATLIKRRAFPDLFVFCWLSLSPLGSLAADDLDRQREVAERGAQIMPFALEKTLHQFTKTKTGGIQRVVVRDGVDQTQIPLIRQHLQEMAEKFSHGDFSGPEAIHDADMPGLAQLKATKAGSLHITYAEEPAGASLTYSSQQKQLVKAVHHWFAAQVHEHGHDAMDMAHCTHHQ